MKWWNLCDTDAEEQSISWHISQLSHVQRLDLLRRRSLPWPASLEEAPSQVLFDEHGSCLINEKEIREFSFSLLYQT